MAEKSVLHFCRTSCRVKRDLESGCTKPCRAQRVSYIFIG